jgi:hypothetical protein
MNENVTDKWRTKIKNRIRNRIMRGQRNVGT